MFDREKEHRDRNKIVQKAKTMQWSLVWIPILVLFVAIATTALPFIADPGFVAHWKTVSIGITGAFGVLGLLTEFRDNVTKKITKWGKLALFGIITSSCLGMVAQFKESSHQELQNQKTANDALLIAKKTDTALIELTRILSPLEEFSVSLHLRIDCSLVDYQSFCADIKNKSNQFRANFPSISDLREYQKAFFGEDARPASIGPDDNNKLVPYSLSINARSSWWSSWPHLVGGGDVVAMSFGIDVFGRGISPDFRTKRGNLHFSLDAFSTTGDNKIEPIYDFRLETLEIAVEGKPENITRDAIIVSTLDLKGATIVFEEYGHQLLTDMKITSFVIKTRAGEVIQLETNRIVPLDVPHDDEVFGHRYKYEFPS